MSKASRSFPMRLAAWAKSVGVNRSTVYRWRRLKLLVLGLEGEQPLNINGSLFIRENEDAAFWKRAGKGELAKELHGIAATQEKAK